MVRAGSPAVVLGLLRNVATFGATQTGLTANELVFHLLSFLWQKQNPWCLATMRKPVRALILPIDAPWGSW